MTLLLGGIAAVSRLADGIGIMKIMLVSVTERMREIGIRMAAGAPMRRAQWQSLIESVVHGLAGGLGGILAGVAAALLLSAVFGWPQLISPLAAACPALCPMAYAAHFAHAACTKRSEDLCQPIDADRFDQRRRKRARVTRIGA